MKIWHFKWLSGFLGGVVLGALIATHAFAAETTAADPAMDAWACSLLLGV
jgi:hypothetical protein